PAARGGPGRRARARSPARQAVGELRRHCPRGRRAHPAAPLATRKSTNSCRPAALARASGVRPSSSCALRSALAFASSCVVTSTPSFTAPCSGVSPCLFRASIGAPRCSSRPAIST
ncbi:unnamed protein product, partial [Prorocentrum cordatum]